MRPQPAVELACHYMCGTDQPCVTLDSRIGAAESLRALLLRDWAVRVLDAWARMDLQQYAWSSMQRSLYSYCCSLRGVEVRLFHDTNADAARLAAAEAVWPELPESIRADLGERPLTP